jgi:sugar/nucleoside kinase (ribokinase family)
MDRAKCKTLILKLGERGALVCRDLPKDDARAFFSVGNFTDHVLDAVGSGDALLSYATLSLYVSKNEAVAVILGSIAAAVECEYDGNIPVTPESVLKKIDLIEKKVNFG